MKTLPIREVGVVGMVQPNEGFKEKFDPGHADSVINTLFSLSRQLVAGSPKPQLLIWPEAAIPGYFVDHPLWDRTISALVRENRIPLLTGGLNAEWDAALRSYRVFNAVFYYDTTGDRSRYPIYAKHYLVPVTERVPLCRCGFSGQFPDCRDGRVAFGPAGNGRSTSRRSASLGW
jgi:apolipoprotein N-acyltransferase